MPAAAQHADSSSFRVYTAAGQPVSLADVVQAARGVDVVLVGESHDDAVGHRVQEALLAALDAVADRPVTLSLEMFERDVQYVVDEYLAGLIKESHFLSSSRPWANYASDYRPLVEYAKAHGLPVLAANAPRRYVNRVARLGPASLADLSAQARAALSPLPYALPSPAYRAKWDTLTGGRHGSPAEHGGAAAGEVEQDSIAAAHAMPPHLLEAQALWDATMAYTVAEHLLARPEALVLHLTGSFHMTGGTGIPEHLQRYRPGTRLLTVLLQPEADVEAFDPGRHGKAAHFVVLTQSAPPAPAP